LKGFGKAAHDAARFNELTVKYSTATEFECITCRLVKPFQAFYRNAPKNSASRPVKSQCKDCLNAYRREKAALDPIGTTQRRLEYQFTPKRRYIVAKKEATRRGLVFEISFAEYCEITSKSGCEYCGVAVVSGGGLDRLDASLGYTPSNVVVCCSICNITKNDIYTAAQMREFGKLIGGWRATGTLTIPPRLVFGKVLLALLDS
jgi:hypothetical protein